MPKISDDAKIRRLADFYDDEIERSKRTLFSGKTVRNMRRIQDRIKFLEERRDELLALSEEI